MKIVLTGGGTAGHAMVNKVMIPFLKAEPDNELLYIGSQKGAERDLIENKEKIAYFPISTGKLRRYMSFENLRDIFRVLKGITEAYGILKRERADIVLSGGGFVSLPVVLAAWLRKIPVIIRETDISMGLANKICARFAEKILTTFPDTLWKIHGVPCECSGLVIRPELLKGKRVDALREEGFDVLREEGFDAVKEAAGKNRINVLIIGGSQGSQRMNQSVWDNVGHLSGRFQITHLCGKNKINSDIRASGYEQLEYADDMSDLYARADVVVMRCGSNAVSEILALGKRAVCIPISTKSSRGEQLANAVYAVQNGCAVILMEERLSDETLTEAIMTVLQKPLNKSCILTEELLNENCRYIYKELQMAAQADHESSKVRHFNKLRLIGWNRISPYSGTKDLL